MNCNNGSGYGVNAYFGFACVALSCFVLTSCATPQQAAGERGPAKCPPHIGQAETEFLRCGCFWDDYSPTPNVQLMSESKAASGLTRVYSCQDLGAYKFTVTVVNGAVSDVKGPSR